MVKDPGARFPHHQTQVDPKDLPESFPFRGQGASRLMSCSVCPKVRDLFSDGLEGPQKESVHLLTISQEGKQSCALNTNQGTEGGAHLICPHRARRLGTRPLISATGMALRSFQNNF